MLLLLPGVLRARAFDHNDGLDLDQKIGWSVFGSTIRFRLKTKIEKEKKTK